MDRSSLRLVASFAVLLATQSACAGAPVAGVAPVPRDELIACRAYRRWMAEAPREPSAAPWVLGGLSAAALVGGVVAAGSAERCKECYGPSAGSLAGAGLLLVGIVGGAVTAAVAAADRDPREEIAARCDEQLRRHCHGLDATACRGALDVACEAGDAEACWAARLEGPLPERVPPSNLARPPCDPKADPQCALDRSLDRSLDAARPVAP